MPIQQDLQTLAGQQLIELFELDATSIGGGVTRFHNGVNELGADVVWQGNTYNRFPIEAQGFEFSGKGQLPRPTLRVANVTGLLGALVRSYQDLIGAKLIRRRTLLKYLDAANFGRKNLLSWSEDITKPEYFSSQVTISNTNTVVINNVTDPIVGQIVYGLGAITGRTFSFGVEVKGIGASIGKYITLYMYSLSVNEVKNIALGPLTADYQLFTITGTFLTSTDTGIVFRVDAENAPAWAVGDSLSVTRWRANEGATLNAYQATASLFTPTPDPTAALPDDVYYIDRKVSENKVLIEFELAAAFDVAGVQLPRRYIVQNVCPWRYRAAECGYTGTAYFNALDQPVGSVAEDVCGKRLSSCKQRFGQNAELPFGGFPAAGLIR